MTDHWRHCPIGKCCCYYCYPSEDGGLVCTYPDEEPDPEKTYYEPDDFTSCIMEESND